MGKKRKKHSASFKARVALDAFKADKTSAELISNYQVSSGQISTWKKRLLQNAPQIFESNSQRVIDEEAITGPLYQEIGRLKMELDWLKKKSAPFH